ncbi:hypothetical protein C1645_744102 [Glomus cerebriforme]|uniref:Uncharacterized protein n=1 Tax=Glomus cerebriforme TaxID=658196 RepID=A0A397S927_9GLOM|nr:hypothetical protein C1645_744102 [Glomus cerebriforme]
MDNYLRKDPSIAALIISDSIYGVKQGMLRILMIIKMKKRIMLKNNGKNGLKKKKANIEEIRALIKEQTETITEIMKDQYTHASEVQQRQHDEQMEILKQLIKN